MTWNYCVDDSTKVRYYMVLGRDILTALLLHPKFSYQVMEADGGPLKGYTAPMVNLGTYGFKYLNTGNITPE